MPARHPNRRHGRYVVRTMYPVYMALVSYQVSYEYSYSACFVATTVHRCCTHSNSYESSFVLLPGTQLIATYPYRYSS
eukprot:scaffold622722_cov38-Prasinocladus_malaysianus.AAC.1